MVRPLSQPPPLAGRPTDGPGLVRWIEGHCVYGQGAKHGDPVALEAFQQYLLHHLGELNDGRYGAGRWRYRRALLEFPKGNGKALALDTPLPTPSGWTTMGAVRPGDQLFDERGRVQRVLEAHPVQLGNRCYRVGFSDGSSIVADAEHLWTTQVLARGYAIQTATTEQLAATLRRGDGAANHRIPTAGPLALPTRSLPVPPYALGLWLGDGDSEGARLTQHVDDLPDVLAALDDEGVRLSVRPGKDERQRRVGLLGTVRPGLRQLGVLGAKHIPVSYQRASAAQRLQLLRGLLDSDGTISAAGQVEFCSTSRRLAHDTLELVRSLGHRPVLHESRATLHGRDCGPRWRLTWTPHGGPELFHLRRKADRQRRGGRGFAPARQVVSVDAVTSVPVRCIRVSGPSQLFLAGPAMVATHNTPLNAWVALYKLWHSKAPLIPVGATAKEQAELLFSDMRACVDASDALQTRLEAFEDRIVLKDGSGMAFKVAAKEGSNDGKRPSMYSADELHEMLTAQQVGAFERLVAGLKKRPDEALGLFTTTPGADLESLLGRLHAAGLKANKGERGADPRLLFVWYGAGPEFVDLDDPAVLEAALRAANPAGDAFLDIAEHVAAFGDMPRFKYERLHLGRWTQVLSAWLPVGAWDACLDEGAAALRTADAPGIALGEEVVLGFDGSLSGDSSALVACTLQGRRLGVVGCWEKPADALPDWRVPMSTVVDVVRKAFRDYRVRELVYDPRIWQQSMQDLASEGYPVVEMPQGLHMADAAQRFYEAVTHQQLGHDGDPRLARHLGNCVGRQTGQSVRVEKESRHSTRWIDLGIAAVMAHDHATAVAEDAGVLVW